MSTDLDLYELKSVHARRQKTKAEIYEKQYKKACQKVKHYNNKYFVKECIYTVPNLQWGYPLFHVQTCICYIMVKLKKAGFDVKFMHPNSIYISWNKAMNKIDNNEAIKRSKRRSKYSDYKKSENDDHLKALSNPKKLTSHSSSHHRPNYSSSKALEKWRPDSHSSDTSTSYDNDREVEDSRERTKVDRKSIERVNKVAEIRALINSRN